MNYKYKELSDRAFKLHSDNKLEKAEELYLQLLKINPDDVNILNLYGLLCISKNNYNEALSVLTKAFVLNKSTYIAANLAKAYYLNNEPDNAIKIYKQALNTEENDDIYYSMAIAYKKLNDFDNVINCYKKAININPNNSNACYNLSLIYKSKNDIYNAIYFAEKSLGINRNDEDTYTLLSELYEDVKNYNSAIDMLKHAISLNNQNNIYYYNIGVLYSKIGQKQSAIEYYKKSIELNKTHVESYVNIASLYKSTDNNIALKYLLTAYNLNLRNENLLLSLSQTYKDLFDNESSIKIINEILEINPKCAEAYSLLGINYMDLGNYDKAYIYYQKAVEISPENLNYIHGKAIALKYMGKTNEAKELLEYIVQKDKNAIQSLITLGMIYLTDKDFNNGMKYYRQRSNESKLKNVFKNKIWNSESVDNKRVLVYSDCGLGDTIMYSRYLPYLKKKVSALTMQTDSDLVSILQNSFNDINIIKKGMLPPEYDYVIPLMDIQYLLQSDFDNIPFSDGYIVPPKKPIPDILKVKKKRIGLFWQGNRKIFKNRSVDFDKIFQLTINKNINFYSFQIDNQIQETDNFFNLKPYINDYSDTALLLNNVDLLITIDSSIAHMAGAIGIKTFLMLPYIAEWRWFKDEKNTPWYNSVELFRQTKNGDWDSVIEKIKSRL